jgi:hypothetical protein
VATRGKTCDAAVVIDRHAGTLHEVNGRLELGPPKTAESARTITINSGWASSLRGWLTFADDDVAGPEDVRT